MYCSQVFYMNVYIGIFQLLAMLYKKKQNLLNSHILHLTFSLIGTIDSGKESSVIPNKKAFQDLLCDLEVRLYFLEIHIAVSVLYFCILVGIEFYF